jgi:NADPH2:quinone reductase
MRAAFYDTPGPAKSVLQVLDVDRPEPGPGQVRVRVALSAINPGDMWMRLNTPPRRTSSASVSAPAASRTRTAQV